MIQAFVNANDNDGNSGRKMPCSSVIFSTRTFAARGLAAGLFAASAFALIGLSSSTAFAEPKDIKWGTGPVGSSGHKALVVLADLLNKEMPEFRITVLPKPGAVATVKGFATGDINGYYGSDVALKEFAEDDGRFKGFKANVKVAAGAVVLVLHARCRPRHQGERPRHHQEMGRPHRQERLSPVRCRSTRACISKTPWRRSASSTSTSRSICPPPARSFSPARSRA